MTSVAQVAPETGFTPDTTARPPRPDSTPHWHPATIIAFRLCFVYFGLYVLTTQMLSGMLLIPGLNVPSLGVSPPVRSVVLWVGRHILGIGHPIVYRTTGSGDKLFDWVHAFSLLLIAVVATTVWSAVARQRPDHAKLFKWFRLFMRIALATTMLTYGFSKAPPMQMPILSLRHLVEPFGDFSPMGVLWFSIGASPAYEIFVGFAELGAGLLLFLPRTALLGAMMCLMDSIAIFTLNMTYDVPVKLFAFHLVLISLFLIAPNARQLFDLFVRHHVTRLLAEPPVGGSDRARRNATIAQVVFGVYVVVLHVYGAAQSWKAFGGGAPKSALYGIWDVEQMTVDGQLKPALLTDSTRWRRVLFQQPGGATFQRMNESFVGYGAVIDSAAKTLTLTSGDSAKLKSPLTFQRPSSDRLILDGTMDGHAVHFELAFRDPDSYLQRSRGFHFVSEVPFNR